MKHDLGRVKPEHVIQAVALIDAGAVVVPPRRQPRNTFLLLNGKHPGKFVRGLAYRLATGVEPDTRANDFNGGRETVKFFKRLGFRAVQE